MVTVHDISGNADIFRAAYRNWPHPEPAAASQSARPGLPYCPVCTTYHAEPLTPCAPAVDACLDCAAETGRPCYPDCLRYAEIPGE